MKNSKIFLLLFISILFINIFSINSYATSLNIVDNSNVLDRQQKLQLQNIAQDFINRRNINITILTFNETNGSSIDNYINNFSDPNGITFAIDTKKQNVYIEAFGNSENLLSNKNIKYIKNSAKNFLKQQKYYDAFYIMEVEGLEQLDININSGITSKKKSSSKNSIGDNIFVYLFTLIIIPGFLSKKVLTYILKKHNEANERLSLNKYSNRTDGYKIYENSSELIKEEERVVHNYYGNRRHHF